MTIVFPTAQMQKAMSEMALRLQVQRQLALEEAAAKMQDLVEKRIFTEGKNSAGVTIGTGITHAGGRSGTTYGTRSKKERSAMGLQIGFVDFYRTGELKRSLRVIRTSNNSVSIQFADTENLDKAQNLDKLKGGTFRPTKFEIAQAKKAFIDTLKNNKLR